MASLLPFSARAGGRGPTVRRYASAMAARDYLARHPEFVSDPEYERLGVTYCR